MRPVPSPGRLVTLVGLASAAVYIFTVQYDFVWDDAGLFAENAYIRSPRGGPARPGAAARPSRAEQDQRIVEERLR